MTTRSKRDWRPYELTDLAYEGFGPRTLAGRFAEAYDLDPEDDADAIEDFFDDCGDLGKLDG